MKRREFITLIGSAAAAWPQLTRAQSELRRIGVLMAYREDDAEAQKYVSVFWDTLKQLGWTEGINISMTMHWAGSELPEIEQAAAYLASNQKPMFATYSPSSATSAADLRSGASWPVNAC